MTAVDLKALREGWGYEVKLAELVRLRMLQSEAKTRATFHRNPGAPPWSPFPAPTGSEANSGTSEGKSGTSPPNSGTSTANDGTSEQSLPLAVLALQRSRKASSDVVNQAILKFCRVRFLTVQEIASLIQRSLARVSNHYLPRLLESGKLEPRHASKHHPGQAYRTRKEGNP